MTMRILPFLLLLAGCPVPEDEKPGDTADTSTVNDTGYNYFCCEEDGDGFSTAEGDCDENDAEINPAADELCNGIDDNCNGEIDEGVENTYYADADGDGFGDPSSTVYACEPPFAYVANAEDCDDSNPNVYPGNYEVCDGVDNDCNGAVDDGVC